MNKILKIATVVLASAAIAACGGGKKEQKMASTTKKEVEKVKVLELQNQRIAKQLELSSTLE